MTFTRQNCVKCGKPIDEGKDCYFVYTNNTIEDNADKLGIPCFDKIPQVKQ